MTTLTEDLMLLLVDDRGRSRASSTVRGSELVVVAGAAVAELALDGALRVTGQGEPGVRAGRLAGTGQAPSDPRLAPLLDAADGRRPKDAVRRLTGWSMSGGPAGELRDRLRADLASRNALGPRQEKVLWLFPVTRWAPGPDTTDRDDAHRRVRAALTGPGTPDGRTAALVSLLLVSGALPSLLPDLDRAALKTRAQQVAEGDWAGPAVRRAVEEVYAAVFAATAAAGAAAATSS